MEEKGGVGSASDHFGVLGSSYKLSLSTPKLYPPSGGPGVYLAYRRTNGDPVPSPSQHKVLRGRLLTGTTIGAQKTLGQMLQCFTEVVLLMSALSLLIGQNVLLPENSARRARPPTSFRESVTPVHFWPMSARPVRYYAVLKRWLLPSPLSGGHGCSYKPFQYTL